METENEQNDIIDNSFLDDELKEQLDGSVEVPNYTAKDNIFRFFYKILGMPDSTKVAFTTKEETGKSFLSIRSYLELALYMKEEGHENVFKYLKSRAEILSATSMGRDGRFMATTVTQIRKDHKISPTQASKPRFWEKSQPQQQGEQ